MIDTYATIPDQAGILSERIFRLKPAKYRIRISAYKNFSRDSQNWYRANNRLIADHMGVDENWLHNDRKIRLGFCKETVTVDGEIKESPDSESQLTAAEHYILCRELEREAIWLELNLISGKAQ